MPTKIDEGFMSMEIDGKIVAIDRERTGGWWEVSHWPRCFHRNWAVTALTVTELLETGRDSNDPRTEARRFSDPSVLVILHFGRRPGWPVEVRSRWRGRLAGRAGRGYR